ncbi:hypothetical protein QE152_g25079 [Popillia japonica]|uniref:Uncharacterized protein n=1 Tax=Popillia japonica TaxID=7064 RepID=A0AAW1K1G4_POPJA
MVTSNQDRKCPLVDVEIQDIAEHLWDEKNSDNEENVDIFGEHSDDDALRVSNSTTEELWCTTSGNGIFRATISERRFQFLATPLRFAEYFEELLNMVEGGMRESKYQSENERRDAEVEAAKNEVAGHIGNLKNNKFAIEITFLQKFSAEMLKQEGRSDHWKDVETSSINLGRGKTS